MADEKNFYQNILNELKEIKNKFSNSKTTEDQANAFNEAIEAKASEITEQYENTITDLNDRVEVLEGQNEELENSVKEKDEKIENLTNEISSLKGTKTGNDKKNPGDRKPTEGEVESDEKKFNTLLGQFMQNKAFSY